MTDMSPEPTETDDEGTAGDSAVIRDLRKRAKAGDEATAAAKAADERARTAEQKAALLELGVKPDSPQGKKLLRLHDGDWNADAIRATATEYGESLGDGPAAEQVAAAQKAAAVSEGSEHTTTVSDWQGEIAALPTYGQPGWETAREKALEIFQRHGGTVTRTRGKINKFTDLNGSPITRDTPVGPRNP